MSKLKQIIAAIGVEWYYVKIHKIRHQCTEYHKGLQGKYNSSEAELKQ